MTLTQFDLSNFDIILGMNWLRTYGANIDCEDLKVVLKDESGREVCFYGQREEKSCPIISTIKASRLICQGLIGYLCYAINTQEKEEKAKDIPVVYEFRYVFPQDLPRLLPQREIVFEIELISGAQPISKVPYRMAPTVYGEREERPYPIISTMKASRLICQGFIGYSCYATDAQEKKRKSERYCCGL